MGSEIEYSMKCCFLESKGCLWGSQCVPFFSVYSYCDTQRFFEILCICLQEMLQELLSRVLPAIDVGLEDRDDDVRAVAAEALTPAASAVVSFAGQMVNRILMKLWDILLDLDDLSPSTSRYS